RFSHTVDPKTGRPIEHALASASVLHPSCAWADAYATALMVLGPEAGRAFAEKRGLSVSLLVHAGDNRFDTVNTPAFDDALEAPTASR
ncbi:MAG TPA: FAD:protein FMN transferase, partial [Candidatus Hydrogenedentes bacterium]|nr:FAD:protein FMN transferase [Candidatus Hydrogenedentota bacterium]